MVKVVARIRIKEGLEETVLSLAQTMVEATRLEEGVVSYTFCKNNNDPAVFAFIEEYQSPEALEEHKASLHYNLILPQIMAHTTEPKEVSFYTPVI
jgi:quinol monooxygenase YgiN